MEPADDEAQRRRAEYDLEIFGANATSPGALVCSLEGDSYFSWTAHQLSNLIGLGPGQLTIAEERSLAFAHPVPEYEGHGPQHCEATYASRLRDADHDINDSQAPRRHHRRLQAQALRTRIGRSHRVMLWRAGMGASFGTR